MEVIMRMNFCIFSLYISNYCIQNVLQFYDILFCPLKFVFEMFHSNGKESIPDVTNL